jgi:hypothetical protein
MAWTYSGDPAANDRDAVRFLSGDTDTTNQQINDAEIAYLLAQWNNSTYIAASYACDAIAGKYTSKSDSSKSVGDLSVSTQFMAQAKTFMERATYLRSQASRSFAPPSPNFDTEVFDGSFMFTIGMDRFSGNPTKSDSIGDATD